MTGLGFALLLLAALCADSLPKEDLLSLAGILVALALIVAAVGHKKDRPGTRNTEAAKPTIRSTNNTPQVYRGNGRIVKYE